MKYSIIIPVYNVKSYLEQCINSVLQQTFEDFEILLVDDGSTDGSSYLCDSFSQNDKRIRVIHKENGGLSSARNTGLKAAKGEYVLFLDSDDYWTYSGLLSDAFRIINQTNADLIIFDYSSDLKKIDNKLSNNELEYSFSKMNKEEAFKMLICLNKIRSSACDKIYKSSIIKQDNFLFEEGVFSEDIDWTARVLIATKKINVIDRYAYYYRPNQNSITHNKQRKNIVDLAERIKKIVEYSKPIESELFYEWFMNYCSYQYITFLNTVSIYNGKENISDVIANMKKYCYLLNYHCNRKVRMCYWFNKIFGYYSMLKFLCIFLKFRGHR